MEEWLIVRVNKVNLITHGFYYFSKLTVFFWQTLYYYTICNAIFICIANKVKILLSFVGKVTGSLPSIADSNAYTYTRRNLNAVAGTTSYFFTITSNYSVQVRSWVLNFFPSFKSSCSAPYADFCSPKLLPWDGYFFACLNEGKNH